MTREEAIYELQACVDAWDKWMLPGCSSLDKYKEAVKMALAALRGPTREQVEKALGEWIPVRESEITGFNPKFAGRDPICGYKCSRCKAEAVLDCGAPMTDEAVDILLKRLEALKDGTI